MLIKLFNLEVYFLKAFILYMLKYDMNPEMLDIYKYKYIKRKKKH